MSWAGAEPSVKLSSETVTPTKRKSEIENYRDYFWLERTLLTQHPTQQPNHHQVLEDLLRERGCGGFITTFGELLSPVELVGGAHQVGDLVLLQQLDVVVHGPVLKIPFLFKSIQDIQKGEAVEQKCKRDFVTSRLMV